MTNRVSSYFADLEATGEPPIYRVLAVGNRVVEMCRSRCYYDAVAEADDLSREAAKLALICPAVTCLVVLDPHGKESCRFEVVQPAAEPGKPRRWPGESLTTPTDAEVESYLKGLENLARDLVLLAGWAVVIGVALAAAISVSR